jgi:hypothetical protein
MAVDMYLKKKTWLQICKDRIWEEEALQKHSVFTQ